MVAQMRNIIVKSAPTPQLGDIISKNTRPGCTRYNYARERVLAFGKINLKLNVVKRKNINTNFMAILKGITKSL